MADVKCGVRVLPPLPGKFAFKNVQKSEVQEPMRPKPPLPPKKTLPAKIAPKPFPGRPPRSVDTAPAPPSATPIEGPTRRKPQLPTKSWLKPQGLAQSGDLPSAPSLDEPSRRRPTVTLRTSLLQQGGLTQSADPALDELHRLKPPHISRIPPPRSSSLQLPHPVAPPRVRSSVPPVEESGRPKPSVRMPGPIKRVSRPPKLSSRRRMMSAIPEHTFETDKIVGLSVDNFEDFTQRMGKSLVLFYDSGKPNAADFTNEFAVAAERTEECEGNFGAVDCSQDKALCYREGACSTPMLKIFSDGSLLNSVKERDVFKASKMQALIKLAPAIIFRQWPTTNKPVPRPRKSNQAMLNT